MAYVPDDAVLGNPGLFGFIGKAVSSVARVAVGIVKGVSGGGSVQIAPPQVIIQSPAPQMQLPGSMPSWILPVAAIGGGLLLVVLMGRRKA